MCKAGYQGERCNQPCAMGFYGANCREKCNCDVGVSCHPLTGECQVTCPAGWTGASCNERMFLFAACLPFRGFCYIAGRDADRIRL